MTSTEEFNCIFCKESFVTKEDLQEHFRKHGDPKFNESIKSKNRLLNEAQTCEKWNEDCETVRCDVCTEVFPTISKAITHKHKVHPDHDAKYFCPWCGKLFTMKHLYNKHIQTNHGSGEGGEEKCFHCDYCEVDFLVASAMVYHNKFFHRQDTELAAIGQSRKIKMFGQEPLQIYFCPFCGEEYHNKVNLHKHMGDDHSDENQSPDDVLRCPLCDAVFYHLDAYEVHLTFHSSGDIYSEGNETLSEVVEFSLETVPPVMEKVENCESQEEAEATMNSIGIEKFLQQAMNEAGNDNSNSEVVPGKKKKHKKHKKSKKSAITLDEFLNMNKDVFGEGIDFQGIEEVPTQVVAKQLKKMPLRPKTTTKLLPSMELQKLKKQGIVVKMKSGNFFNKPQGMRIGIEKPIGKPVNTVRNFVPNQRQYVAPAKSNAISTSSDVLTKLLNQSNSQLKIVKKSAQESLKSEEQDSFDTVNTTENKTSDNTECAESDKKESGTKMKNTDEDMTSSGKCNTTRNIIEKQDKKGMENSEVGKDTLASKDTSHDSSANLDSPCATEKDYENTKSISEKRELFEKPIESNINNLNNTEFVKSDTNPANALHALRNISQHITIKSVSSTNITPRPQSMHFKQVTEDFSKNADKGHSVPKQNIECITVQTDKHENECNNDSLNALKHLSHLITVKSANQSKPTSPIGAQNSIVEDKADFEEISHSEMDENIGIEHPVFESPKKEFTLDVKQSKDQKETSKPIDALKSLSKHITIKSINQSSNTHKSIEKPFNDEIFTDEHKDDWDDDGLIKHETHNIGDNKHIETPSHSRCTSAKTALLKSLEMRTQPTNHLPKVIPVPWKEMDKPDEELHFRDEKVIEKESCSNIMKQLPNVTAKPINVKKNQQVSISSTITSSQTMNMKNTNFVQKCEKKEEKEEIEIFNIDDSDDEVLNSQDSFVKQSLSNTSVNNLTTEHTNPVMKPIDALKNLSKHITVKSKMQQPSPLNKELMGQNQMLNDRKDDLPTYESDNDIDNAKSVGALKNLSKHITVKSTNQQKLLRNKFNQEQMVDDVDNDFHKDKSDDDSNVKSVNTLKNLSKHITVKSTNQQKLLRNKCNQEQMVDDIDNDFHRDKSDDDSNVKSVNTLKNLSKHITVKSTNQQKSLKNKISREHITDDGDHDIIYDESDRHMNIEKNNEKFSNLKPVAQKNTALQQTLKYLSKHVSVKSRNSLPNTPVMSEVTHPKQNVLLEGYDSDSNSSSKRITITEINDDNLSDDDFTLDQLKNDYKLIKNIVVDEPNSDNDENDMSPDIEREIQTNTFHKSNSSNLDTMKGISKDIIKKTKEDNNETDTDWDANIKIPNLSNEMSIKPFKQMKLAHKDENNVFSAHKTAIAHVSNRTMNQGVMTSSGQVNTVNKEVTVKTFQTKTVIQEITTTVTKTIRTVNQNSKQEVRNMCQSSMPIMRPQKVQGMTPNQQMRNYQGGPYRQATPSVGHRIRNPGPSTAVGTTVKPSNQLVPVRPAMNIPRVNSPRMPVMKKATPSTLNPQQPQMGKPLKISPNASMPSTKRPNSDESNGPFSCFKKPKESLIPVPDVPSFSNNQEGTVQLASSSHTISRSNFSSSTKMVKGNSVVTSTHMKSEVSAASSEQLSRLSNTSGLKVMNASRAKQTRQVENCQISASKRTALAAIEKLQKQGLLVKKPRLDDNCSEKSHSDGEDYCDT